MQGQLGDKLIAEIIQELAQKKASGLLRLSRNKIIKAIFFEAGQPVFAISTLPREQLEQRLLAEGLVTTTQIEQAKAKIGKSNRLGTALVEMGVLKRDQMQRLVRQHVTEIIMSLFEWSEGDYFFDDRIRATHDATIDTPVADLILDGARHAARSQALAQAIAPSDAVITRARTTVTQMDSGRLMPLESYVLSRIESPTMVSEVGTLSGIAEDEAQRAVCALVAAGFLKLVGDEKDEPKSAEPVESLEQLRDEVARKLHFYATADFYEILETTRQATTAEIKTAYYQLAKKYHPDRYSQPAYRELRPKFEAIFAKITEAYDTLRQPAARAAYDERIRKSQSRPLSAPPMGTGTLIHPTERKPAEEKPSTSGRLKQPAQAAAQAAGASSSEAPRSQPAAMPQQSAEHFYQQGRARYDRKEYHLAVHLLREAVRLDPARPQYHYHLAMALVRNPRTRREAEQHLVKAAELDPYNALIRVKLGQFYKEVGLAKRAEHYFKEALQLDPENRVAKRELGLDGTAKPSGGSVWKADLGGLAKKLFKK